MKGVRAARRTEGSDARAQRLTRLRGIETFLVAGYYFAQANFIAISTRFAMLGNLVLGLLCWGAF